jgi:hypothetical protein
MAKEEWLLQENELEGTSSSQWSSRTHHYSTCLALAIRAKYRCTDIIYCVWSIALQYSAMSAPIFVSGEIFPTDIYTTYIRCGKAAEVVAVAESVIIIQFHGLRSWCVIHSGCVEGGGPHPRATSLDVTRNAVLVLHRSSLESTVPKIAYRSLNYMSWINSYWIEIYQYNYLFPTLFIFILFITTSFKKVYSPPNTTVGRAQHCCQ